MVNFTVIDWFWVVAYILLMVACGVLFYRLASRSESDFFLAGRGLTWWLIGISIVAANISTEQFQGYIWPGVVAVFVFGIVFW